MRTTTEGLTDRWPMGNLTVRAVVQVNLSRFVLFYSNTATQKYSHTTHR